MNVFAALNVLVLGKTQERSIEFKIKITLKKT